MSDPREHYCVCGRWGSFGKTVPRGATVWFCGLVGGEPACSHGVLLAPEPEARKAHDPDTTIATAGTAQPQHPEPDLFGAAK